ncbi:MAG: hypothetical protein KF895_15215 [Parvibaculum sp.]|nr:hypothetical protein [Parvibaculum sp.]
MSRRIRSSPNQYFGQITSKMVITSKIYEVSMGRMVNNGTIRDFRIAFTALAKSERQKVKPEPAVFPSGDLSGSIEFGQELRAGPPSQGKPEADGAGPAIFPERRKPGGQCQNAHRDSSRLSCRRSNMRRKAGPAGTRRLGGCAKG